MTSNWEGEFSQQNTSVLSLSPLSVLNPLLSPVLLLKLFYTETRINANIYSLLIYVFFNIRSFIIGLNRFFLKKLFSFSLV